MHISWRCSLKASRRWLLRAKLSNHMEGLRKVYTWGLKVIISSLIYQARASRPWRIIMWRVKQQLHLVLLNTPRVRLRRSLDSHIWKLAQKCHSCRSMPWGNSWMRLLKAHSKHLNYHSRALCIKAPQSLIWHLMGATHSEWLLGRQWAHASESHH